MLPHKSLALPTACGSRSFLEAEAAPAESFCVAREGIFCASAQKTNLSMCLKRREAVSLKPFRRTGWFVTIILPLPKCRAKTAPFASFSGRAEKEGPARPERGPIYDIVLVHFDKTICLF